MFGTAFAKRINIPPDYIQINSRWGFRYKELNITCLFVIIVILSNIALDDNFL